MCRVNYQRNGCHRIENWLKIHFPLLHIPKDERKIIINSIVCNQIISSPKQNCWWSLNNFIVVCKHFEFVCGLLSSFAFIPCFPAAITIEILGQISIEKLATCQCRLEEPIFVLEFRFLGVFSFPKFPVIKQSQIFVFDLVIFSHKLRSRWGSKKKTWQCKRKNEMLNVFDFHIRWKNWEQVYFSRVFSIE